MNIAKNSIRIIGAREHNLQNISIDIPKEKLVVITGPSGSGKSSLALDTLYAEGQRRYVESLSSYARQFLGVAKKPLVDKIEGLCPAIAIEQKTVGYNPRSTVGTTTEIYDYLRVLFARVGIPHCPNCGVVIQAESPERITHMLLASFKEQVVTVAAPIAIEKKGEFTRELSKFFDQGFTRLFINGKLHRFKEKTEIEQLDLKKNYKHNISIIIDKMRIEPEDQVRVQEAIEKAFALNGGLANIVDEDGKERLYSSQRICIACARSFPELEPRYFSFNSPLGACKSCHGLGVAYGWMYAQASEKMDPETLALPAESCRACSGTRLQDEALAVKVAGKNIYEWCIMPINHLLAFCHEYLLSNEAQEKQEIVQPLLLEITSRLTFLNNVGLSYLTLARTSRSLSGGEGQRIRLATQIGSSLSGIMYILDEPSIGLHQRDNDRLIATLKLLRDQGNTVIVVEHDMDTIQEADYLIDMGPGAGIQGGRVIAAGTPQAIAQSPDSITGAYLSGKRQIAIPAHRRKPRGFITVQNVICNNIKELTANIPVGVFAAVSGVSGSGKSSLIMQTLAPALHDYFTRGYAIGKSFDQILNLELISNVVMVDQSPIGRTPRSNPATYLGIFNDIRNLFASLSESKARGYAPGRFSFNVSDGRCAECNGEGSIKVSMHFLEDVVMVCKSCKGKRYNQQTLEIRYKEKNIFEVLEMTAVEACDFFKSLAPIYKRVALLCEVGLDYLKLGQSSTTLSGGEAQRIKLVNELAKRDRNTMYILDEPTTGLHNCDIEKLLTVLNTLVDRGNSVLVIEHNLDVLKVVDYLIDIGPEGGEGGGTIVAEGTPEKVASCARSFTGQYLKKIFGVTKKSV